MRVPQITRSVEQAGLPDVRQVADTNADMFGAGQARGIRAAGHAVSKLADSAFAISQDMQREVDEAHVREADTAFTEDLNNEMTRLLNRRGKDAIDDFDGGEFDKKVTPINQHHNKALTPSQAELWADVNKRRIEGAKKRWLRHVQAERAQYVEQTAVNRVKSLTDEAASNYADESIVRRNLATALIEVREMRNRNGWSAETAKVKAMEVMDAIHVGVASRMAEDDLAGARDYFERNKGEISADTERRIERYLDAQDEINKRRRRADEREAEKVEREAQARLTSDLEIKVRRGEAGVGEIENAYDGGEGYLTPDKRTQLISVADKFERTEQKRFADIGRVAAALNGTGPAMDGKQAADRKAVDAYYEGIFKPSLAPIPVVPESAPDGVEDPASWLLKARTQAREQRDRQASAVVTFVRSAGVIPTELQSNLRTTLRNGGATQRAYAADLVARIRERNPMLLNGFSKPELQLATQIDRLVKSGVPATRAAEIADEALKADPAEREERQLRLRADKLLDNAENVIKGEMAGGFMGFGQAETSDAIVGEYKVLFREHFLATGDEASAKTLAVDDLKRVWGVSQIGGKKRLMKYPPENYGFQAMDTDGNGEWMQEQLSEDLRDAGLSDDDIEAARLDSDILTGRSLGNPSWPVMIERDGVVEPFMVDGKPMRWRPDWNAKLAKWQEEDEADNAAALQAAKNERNGVVDNPGPMVP